MSSEDLRPGELQWARPGGAYPPVLVPARWMRGYPQTDWDAISDRRAFRADLQTRARLARQDKPRAIPRGK
jgi:hypothetical protein